jgi:tetratricopeptide (TPR) repeat protein
LKLNISKKINLIFFISIQIVALTVGLIFYFRYSEALMNGATTNLLNGIYSTDIFVSGKDLSKLDKESYLTDEYKSQWKKLRSVQEKFGLTYLYILLPNQNGQFYYTYETGDDPEVKATKNSDGTYNFEYVGDVSEERRIEKPNQPAGLDTYFEIYDDAPSGVKKSFESGKLVTEEYKDKHGTFKSGFFPLVVDKKIIGVIAADYEITHIINLKRNALITLISILSISLILALIVRMLIQKIIIKPILKLNNGSKEISNGNLKFQIDVKQKDELGELANSFNLMAKNLDESFNKIKEYNDLLEEKVKQRTFELQTTLEKVQELKVQQDGDYFLTSLLTEPLLQNRSKSDLIHVETYLEQKKKFHFKNKQKHLGGDLCILGDLNFRGKKHIMFFNGDAMGKSMQGAGGALVIGSIVNSIMARSAANKKVLTIEPKQWIYEAFYEIQRVMESFDGAMFVSCILGLIDEQTGKMIYFNAEHPFSILYRDGVANFLEDKIGAHKIGTPNNHLEVFEFQFHLNDVIYCGSDGKDDLVLETDSVGNRVINEDETIILRSIEEGNGILKDVIERIKSKGEISDDLSLMRLEFTNANPIEEQKDKKFIYDQDNLIALNNQITELIKQKEYNSVIEMLSSIKDDTFAKDYYLGISYSRLGNFTEAAVYLEEANKKVSNHKQALRQMGLVYYELGKFEESHRFLSKFIKLVPEDSKVILIINDLEEKLNKKNLTGF